MTRDKDMPPDPWAEEGVDLWTLEQAERLAREGVTGDDPRWRALEDEGPLVDDFDENEEPDRQSPPDPYAAVGRSHHGQPTPVRFVAAALIVLIVLAILLMYTR